MADIRWAGEAAAVARVDKFTPASVEIGDIFTLTVTGLDGTTHSISFTATVATVANVTAGLTAAWNASTNALCTPITASDQTTYMKLTADTAGVGFNVTASTTNGGAVNDQTLTKAAVTANAGPKDWSSADNWSGDAVPGGAADQDVYIEDFSGDILYGLDQSGIANTLASLNIGQSFTGKIGSNGAAGHAAEYLKIKATAVNIGYNYSNSTLSGSGRIKIDTGSTASTITIYNTGTAADTGKPAIRLLANSASTVIRVLKGTVSIAFEAGETTTVDTISVSYVSSINSDADVFIGDGVTMTTVAQTGGDVISRSGATAITSEAGTLKTYGSGAITTLNVKGGITTPNSTGTITNLNVTGGECDFTKSQAARTVTTAKLDPGGVLKYDPSVVTMTNKVQPYSSSGAVSYTAAAA